MLHTYYAIVLLGIINNCQAGWWAANTFYTVQLQNVATLCNLYYYDLGPTTLNCDDKTLSYNPNNVYKTWIFFPIGTLSNAGHIIETAHGDILDNDENDNKIYLSRFTSDGANTKWAFDNNNCLKNVRTGRYLNLQGGNLYPGNSCLSQWWVQHPVAYNCVSISS